jgi:uncharacterized protein (DUF362 family)
MKPPNRTVPGSGMDRREFVKRSFLGTAGLAIPGQALSAHGDSSAPSLPAIQTHGLTQKTSPLGLPGLFPGKVVELSSPEAIIRNRVSQPLIRDMLQRGMCALTGEGTSQGAWARFVTATDIVGIKINPSGAPACCSSPEIIREIVSALQSVGVAPRNIIIYDRYAYEIDIGSYQALVPAEVRVIGIQEAYNGASGYDMDIYCQANFFGEWETRSYMAGVVAREVTKIINVPTMKDHSAAGVTGCLKNLAYGTFNNVARSHRAPYSFTDPLIGVMCTVEPLRSKAVLHIMDGMRQVWHGGPLTQVQDFIYPAGTLLIGTDPVAIDTIELEKIEAKRKQEGAPSVWDHDPASITPDSGEFFRDPRKNLFYRRPGHIASAGKLGLGESDRSRIVHDRIA